jgi:uncharacterized membrane protein
MFMELYKFVFVIGTIFSALLCISFICWCLTYDFKQKKEERRRNKRLERQIRVSKKLNEGR